MSTKTTFKRVALVAVAALGLGVLSVVPSSAAVVSTTVSVGTDGAVSIIGTTTGVSSDSTTAAVFTVNSLMSATTDSASVTFVKKAEPKDSTVIARMNYLDTATTTSTGVVATDANKLTVNASKLSANTITDSVTAGSYLWLASSSANGYATARFTIGLDSATAVAKAGTYTYTVVVTPYTAGTAQATQYTADVNIVVSASTDQSKTPSAVKSFANLVSSAKTAGTAKETSDAVQSIVATAGTAAGYVFVGNRNSVDGATTAEDSLTAVVTGAGVVCSNTGTAASPVVGTCGKSLSKIAVTGDYEFILQADGTAGVSTVSITSGVLGVTYTKTLSFYAKAAKTITASVLTPILTVGTNDSAVVVTAVDANGTAWTGTPYIYAATAADALIGGSATTPVACVLSTDKSKAYCPVSTKAAGTANFKVIDAATIATANATADVKVTASAATAATVKVAFDKATYAPGEKAVVTVTPLDASGNAIAASTGNYLAAALTSNVAFVSGGTTTTSLAGASVTTEAYAGTDKSAGSQSFVIYMPMASGTVTLTGKGGSALPLAGQVAVTASADVVNASVDAATDAANQATDAANAATDAALAAADAADAATAAAQDASDAVAALSATVAKLVASLKAQITSLTNLVIKIQKKVKA